jgi:uncharacterized protein (DUF2062 family)
MATDIISKHCKIALVLFLDNKSRILREEMLHALNILKDVIVVDSGVTDISADIPDGINYVNIAHRIKKTGKGTAVLTAAKEAGSMGMSHIVTIGTDGQHDPYDILNFISAIEENSDSIIVGRRAFQKDKTGWTTRFSRQLPKLWLRLQTGQILEDPQSDFRAYPLSVLENLKVHEKGYAFETEVLVRATWAGISLREQEIASPYCVAAWKRLSPFRALLVDFRVFLLNLLLAMRSVAPVPHRKIVNKKDGSGQKISVLRPIRSIKTLLTENTSPGQLAVAGALGVFLGTLPLIAFHTIVILFAAGFFRLNKVAAVSSSQLCMPPLVPALCIEVGYFMRHGEFLVEISFETLGYQALERLFEWLIGSLIVAPVLALLVGGIVYVIALGISREKRITP